MAPNLLVINVDLRETRVALIQDGVIAELQIERASARSTVGNIVSGKVTRVLPGMQAAFIDVGMDRAAFLHVEDLIRPDDFDKYLAGDPREEIHAAGEDVVEGGEDDDRSEGADEDATDDPDNGTAVGENGDDEEHEPGADDGGTGSGDEGGGEDTEADRSAEEADGPTKAASEADGAPNAATETSSQPDTDATGDSDDGTTKRVTPLQNGGRRRKKRRRGNDTRTPAPTTSTGKVRQGRRRGKKSPARVTRSVPITEVVKEGDSVIVQISKEPIGTKGARVTSHVSLAGRYVVYLPTVDHVGISKRIGSARERTRLRSVIESLLPKKGGLIVRTVAEGLTKKQLKTDIGYLIRVWQDVSKKAESAQTRDVLYTELDLVLKTARDLFTDDIEKIIIDDKEQYQRLLRFMEMFMPERAKDVEYYPGEEPIFDAYGIEDEIGRALSRKVPLASGGHLIIDQAEALTAIDVNTGRYVGKGSKDLEETALKTNLEAIAEIAYQLRFRNIGGLVILDLIDMDRPANRDKVVRALEKLLAKDKAKTTLQRISELGLVEMTRKRTRESLGRLLHEPCFYCDGTGQIQSRETIAYEILRQISRERQTLPGYCVHVNAHPAIVDLLRGEEKEAVQEAERRLTRRIELTPRREYHIEQFDLQGK